jgi:hypothetical protein
LIDHLLYHGRAALSILFILAVWHCSTLVCHPSPSLSPGKTAERGKGGGRSSRLVYMWVCFLFNHRNGILVIYILLMGYWVDCRMVMIWARKGPWREREKRKLLGLDSPRLPTAGTRTHRWESINSGRRGCRLDLSLFLFLSPGHSSILLFPLPFSPPSSLSIPSLSGSHTSVYHFLCHVMCAL